MIIDFCSYLESISKISIQESKISFHNTMKNLVENKIFEFNMNLNTKHIVESSNLQIKIDYLIHWNINQRI